jgi:hypothetical protein
MGAKVFNELRTEAGSRPVVVESETGLIVNE